MTLLPDEPGMRAVASGVSVDMDRSQDPARSHCARTEVWTRAEQLEEHAAAVDDLLASTGAPVMVGRRWWRAWLEAFPDASPWVVARIDGSGRLVALAPLARYRRAGWTQLVALGDGVSDQMRLPARTDRDAVALARFLVDHLHAVRGAWTIDLCQLPLDDDVVGALAVGLPNASVEAGAASPRTAITSRESSHYLSRNHRKIARNMMNRLETGGHRPRVEFLTQPEDVGAVLDEVVRVCRVRQREMMGRSHLDAPEMERFFRRAVTSLAEDGAIEVALLMADDGIAAYQVDLLDDRVYRIWNPHYDPVWAAFSPGHVLRHHVVERVVADDRYHEIDWMMGTQPYKMRRATHTVDAVRLRASSSRLAGMAAFGPERIRRRAVTVAREHESSTRVLEFLRRARRHLPGSASA